MSTLPAESPVPSSCLASAGRLLLVEDDPLQARGLLRLLDQHGFQAHCVPDVPAALAAVASQPAYDFIVADVGLPGASGAELARRLRQPLLIAYSGRERRPPWFDAHVVKPRVEELLRLLGATRLTVSVLSLGAGECLGYAEEAGIVCRAASPAAALRLLALAIERPAGSA